MSTTFEKLGSGQPQFTTESQEGDYVIKPALGAAEPTALEITAKFVQYRANYSRPLANSNITYGAQTAYFVNDDGFSDRRGGLTEWTRTWATLPATWYEDSQYAFAYPAYAGSNVGNTANVTAIAANRALLPYQYTLNAANTGLAAADAAFVDVAYLNGSTNIHVTSPTRVLSANTTAVIITGTLLDYGTTFTSVTGTIRKLSAYRSTPADTEPIDAIVTHDYAFTDGTVSNIANALPTIPAFAPIDALGDRVDNLATTTVPTSATYASMVAAGTLIVAEASTRSLYAGLIHERKTIQVKAG